MSSGDESDHNSGNGGEEKKNVRRVSIARACKKDPRNYDDESFEEMKKFQEMMAREHKNGQKNNNSESVQIGRRTTRRVVQKERNQSSDEECDDTDSEEERNDRELEKRDKEVEKVVTRRMAASKREEGQRQAEKVKMVEENSTPRRPVLKRHRNNDDGPSEKRRVTFQGTREEREYSQVNENQTLMTIDEMRRLKTYILTHKMLDDSKCGKYIGKTEKFFKTIKSSELTKRELVLKALLAFRRLDLAALENLLKTEAFPTPFIDFLKKTYLSLHKPSLVHLPFEVAIDDSEKINGDEALWDAHLQQMIGFDMNWEELMEATDRSKRGIEYWITLEKAALEQWDEKKVDALLEDTKLVKNNKDEIKVLMRKLEARQREQQRSFEVDTQSSGDEVMETSIVVEEEVLNDNEAINQDQVNVPAENPDAHQREEAPEMLEEPKAEAPAVVEGEHVVENEIPNAEDDNEIVVLAEQHAPFTQWGVLRISTWAYGITGCLETYNIVQRNKINGRRMADILADNNQTYFTALRWGQMRPKARRIQKDDEARQN